MSTTLKQSWSVGALLLLAGALLAGGCGTTGVRAAVFVPVGPPGPISETMIVSPGVGYVWVPGHHHWDGAAYAWTSGRWERGPHPRARWEPGRWKHSRQGWYWVEGRWR